MKRLGFVLGTAAVAGLVLWGCSSSLELVAAKAEPNVVSPGQKGRVVVILKGAKDKVGTVQAVVREYPEYTFRLNDEGRMGDEKAGDGVWTYEFPVPYDAPAQKYHVDIIIKDKEGNVIKFGETQGPAASLVVEVR